MDESKAFYRCKNLEATKTYFGPPVKGPSNSAVSEKELEWFIYAHPEEIDCDNTIASQLTIGTGKVDVVASRGDSVIVVVEVKHRIIDCDAVGQLARYLACLRDGDNSLQYEGCLVGTCIKYDALFLADALEYRVFLLHESGTVSKGEVFLEDITSKKNVVHAEARDKAIGIIHQRLRDRNRKNK